MNPVNFCKPFIGLDVEFFFKNKNHKIVGSEKILEHKTRNIDNSEITIDGVQAELNPLPSYCRELLRGHIYRLIEKLLNYEYIPVFKSNITLSQKEMDSLSEESKIFGCKPSFDAYNDGKESKMLIKGTDTLQRTAGGHIHLGLNKALLKIIPSNKKMKKDCLVCPLPCKEYELERSYGILDLISKINIHEIKSCLKDFNPKEIKRIRKILKQYISDDIYDNEIFFDISPVMKALQQPKITIPLLDLFCGIPSVLLDISNDAKIRRQLYGKAGDYRLPFHGIEYRTLSNFWIKSYPLMSLFTGLARHALLLAANEIENKTYCKEIYDIVSKKEIKDAINNNDFNKAKEIFLKTENFIINTAVDEEHFPLNCSSIIYFKQFVIDGIKKYFSDDVINNWKNRSNGWESWCINNICIEDVTSTLENFKNLTIDKIRK